MSRDELGAMVLEFGGPDLVGRRVEANAVPDVDFRHQGAFAAHNLSKKINFKL
jgi:hypothetical protein